MTLFETHDCDQLLDEVTVDAAEAARLIPVNRGKFDLMVEAGELTPLPRVGRKRRFLLRDVIACRRHSNAARPRARQAAMT